MREFLDAPAIHPSVSLLVRLRKKFMEPKAGRSFRTIGLYTPGKSIMLRAKPG
jgi:hypothetical protein